MISYTFAKYFLYLRCLRKLCLLSFSFRHFYKQLEQIYQVFQRLCLQTRAIYDVMIANSTCPFFILNQKNVTFHYAFTILILIIQSTNKLKLPKAQTSQVNIFYLSQFFFWTRNNNWTNSSIAMQVPFVRLIIQEADSGLVKLVVMTNVFFNKQQNETKIKPFIFVKYIKSRFFSNS